jgi:uracil-DNA glycosylase family 4
MFTGDASGGTLYRVLHATGFSSRPQSWSRDDGLRLIGAYLTAAGRCAPPANKPTPQELRNCRPFLEREIDLLRNVRVVVALGRIAFDIYLGILRDRGLIQSRALYKFAHNAVHHLGDDLPVVISSYHPSQQNTSTGKLNDDMLCDVFANARNLFTERDLTAHSAT